jgi:hypothetical protein
MRDMKYIPTVLVLIVLMLASSCVGLSQANKIERFSRRSGISSLSDQTLQQLDLHLTCRRDGILRVVVPLRREEAATLQGDSSLGEWVSGPIPSRIWKGTIQMGDWGRIPPDKFIPMYTNTLEYVYRKDGAHFHMYVLDRTDSQEPLLYYVYFNTQ